MYLLISEYCRLYCYDGDQIIAEYDGSDTLLRKFVYGPGIDEPICMIDVTDNNKVYYYHFDGLGSVVALSDSNAVIAEQYSYDIFGKPSSISSIGNPYMFTGRNYDSETELYYYRARYYDYANGRFLGPDPIGYNDGMNLYTYVGNNPLMLIDPFGLCKDENDNYYVLPNGQRIPAPLGYDPLKNAVIGQQVGRFGFKGLVDHGEEMDYKRLGHNNMEITHPEYEAIGNFNYGLVGRAAGFSERRLLREAGRAQRRPDGTYPGAGNPGNFWNPWGGIEPYGDLPDDIVMIKQGFRWYDENYMDVISIGLMSSTTP